MNSLSNKINLTDEQIEARFKDMAYVTELSVTTDTIEDFLAARKSWNQAGVIQKNESGELVVLGMQTAKGQPRRDLYVVDFGQVRVSIDF